MVYCFCVLSRESSSAHQLGDRTSYIGDKRPLLIFLGVLEGLAEVATVGVGIAALVSAIVLSTPAIAACFAGGAALAALIALGVIKANQHVSNGEPTTEEKPNPKPSPKTPSTNASELEHQPVLPEEGPTERSPHQTPSPNVSPEPAHQPESPKQGDTEPSLHLTSRCVGQAAPKPGAKTITEDRIRKKVLEQRVESPAQNTIDEIRKDLERRSVSPEQDAIEGPTEQSPPLPLTTRSVSYDYRRFLFEHQVKLDLGPCYRNLSTGDKRMLREQVYNDLCGLLKQGGKGVEIPATMLNGGKAELSKTREGHLCICCKAESLASVQYYFVCVKENGDVFVHCPDLAGRDTVSITLVNDGPVTIDSFHIKGSACGCQIRRDPNWDKYKFRKEGSHSDLPEDDVLNSLSDVTLQFLITNMDKIISRLSGEPICGEAMFGWLLSFFGSIGREDRFGGDNAQMLAAPLEEESGHSHTMILARCSDVQTDDSGVRTITSPPITSCVHIAQDSFLKLIIKIYPNGTITIESTKTSFGRAFRSTAERRALFVQRSESQKIIECHIVKGEVSDIEAIGSKSSYKLSLGDDGSLMAEGLGATRHVASSFLAHHYIQTEACVVQDSRQAKSEMSFMANCFGTITEVLTDPNSMFVIPGKGFSRNELDYSDAGLVRVCDGVKLNLRAVVRALKDYQHNTKKTQSPWSSAQEGNELGITFPQMLEALAAEDSLDPSPIPNVSPEPQPESSEQGLAERSPLPPTIIDPEHMRSLLEHNVDPNLGSCYLNLSDHDKKRARKMVFLELYELVRNSGAVDTQTTTSGLGTSQWGRLPHSGRGIAIPVPMLNKGTATLSTTHDGALSIHCKAESVEVQSYDVCLTSDGSISVCCPNMASHGGRISMTLRDDAPVTLDSFKVEYGGDNGIAEFFQGDVAGNFAYKYKGNQAGSIRVGENKSPAVVCLPKSDVLNSLGNVTLEFMIAHKDKIIAHLRDESISGEEMFKKLLSFFDLIRGGTSTHARDDARVADDPQMALVCCGESETDDNGVVTITSHPIISSVRVAQDSFLRLIWKSYPDGTVTIESTKHSSGRGLMAGISERRVLFVQKSESKEEIECHIVKGDVNDISAIQSESSYKLLIGGEGRVIVLRLGQTRQVETSLFGHFKQTDKRTVQDGHQTRDDISYLANCFETIVTVLTDPTSMFVIPGEDNLLNDQVVVVKPAQLVRVCNGQELDFSAVVMGLKTYRQNVYGANLLCHGLNGCGHLGIPGKQVRMLLDRRSS